MIESHVKLTTMPTFSTTITDTPPSPTPTNNNRQVFRRSAEFHCCNDCVILIKYQVAEALDSPELEGALHSVPAPTSD